MSSSKPKTRFIAQLSIESFISRNKRTFFWSFTEPGNGHDGGLHQNRTKDEAEACFKPFRDMCARNGAELLVVWEKQERGAWHPHCLVNEYIDVKKLRPWMMLRGWGPQMKVVRVEMAGHSNHNGVINARVVMRYLTKYLTKSATTVLDVKKKVFSCVGAGVKCGTTKFSWAATEKAGRYLWWHGRAVFFEMFGLQPTFRDCWTCIRLGVDATGWADIDFLWQFGFT